MGRRRQAVDASTRRRFQRTALLCAAVAFGATSALALVAADWPPPWRILWLELLLATLAVAVYFRVSSRLAARSRGRRMPVAAFEGAVAAIASGLVLLALSPGEPDVTPGAMDNLIGLLAIGLVGAATAQSLWGLAIRLDRPSPRGVPFTTTSQ